MKTSYLEFRLNRYVCFAVCLLLMVMIPICHSHKLLGYDLTAPDKRTEAAPATLSSDNIGDMVINTTDIGAEITGFAGPTPVEIVIKDGKVAKITALPNDETPSFMSNVEKSGLLQKFDGKSVREGARLQVDAVTGATYTSTSLIRNIHKGLSHALDETKGPTTHEVAGSESTEGDYENSVTQAIDEDHPFTAKFFITIAIILAGAILPLFLRNNKYRIVQLVLNTVILGFWGGTFISYTLMVSSLTNGMVNLVLIPSALLLIVAFVFPFFGRVNHYCNWLCPYGSLQELIGHCCKKKIPLTPNIVKSLNIFRRILWFALMWLLWTGLWFDWMGYEPFAAFFFNEASPAVLVLAGLFLVLSLFVNRPYCRFVCPTGTLFKFSEGCR